jgi:oxygen-independent coproporphyrinogen-3 oxidase
MSEKMNIDNKLVKKYDRPGPRYTSYPTAPHFAEDFDRAKFYEELEIANEAKRDLSLYVHLPYCDTLCYFCGCNMIVSNNRKRIHSYEEYVKMEIDLLREKLEPGRKVVQLHWGGGTPTHLKPEEILDLGNYLKSNFEYSDDAEVSCEIDPRGMTKEHLIALRESGFNRVSMGVQDFNEKVQKAVNRIQPESITTQVIDWARELGFQSINLDLMYGLPFQRPETFEETIDKIIEISPDRIAVFNYAHVPWIKKHQSLIKTEDLPKPEVKFELFKLSIEKLTSAGYVFIGMDHFAKPDDELAVALREKKLYRNFQGYSTRSGTDLHAMGITGISQFGRIYSQNIKTEKPYYEALEKGELPIAKGYYLSEDDVLRRYVIMKIMCDFELDFREVENQFGIDFEKYFAWGLNNIREMIDDGLVEIKDKKLVVNNTGRLLIRNVAMNFDYFIENNKDNMKYSRTV